MFELQRWDDVGWGAGYVQTGHDEGYKTLDDALDAMAALCRTLAPIRPEQFRVVDGEGVVVWDGRMDG